MEANQQHGGKRLIISKHANWKALEPLLRGFLFTDVENGGEIAYTMGKREKLLQRLLSRPKDFIYEEAVTLMHGFKFIENNKGKTSGTRVMFVNAEKNRKIVLHKPHPNNVLPGYAVDKLIRELINAGFIS